MPGATPNPSAGAEIRTTEGLVIIFEMFNARVHDLLYAQQLFGEKLFHGVKALIHAPAQIVDAFVIRQNCHDSDDQ